MGRFSKQTTRRPLRRWLIGLVLLAASATLIGWLARYALAAGWFEGMDALAGQKPPSPTLESLANGVSAAATAVAAAVVSILLAVVLLLRRRAGDSIMLVGSAMTAIVAQNLLKEWVNRVPGGESVITHTGTFPSGHAFFSVAVYGLFAYFFARSLRSTKGRIAVALASLLHIALVSYSRLVLQAQFVSDILCGLLLGSIWLAVAAWVTSSSVKQGRGSSFRR